MRRQLTPGLISSLPGTDELLPFISFSTGYPELDFAVLRHTDNERFVGNLGGRPPKPLRDVLAGALKADIAVSEVEKKTAGAGEDA